jgi:hypothetical protein
VAVQYSGVKEGRPKAMVLVITVSAVDRGACIRDLSQVGLLLVTSPISRQAPVASESNGVRVTGGVKVV